MKNPVLTQINDHSKTALRALHESQGFDFEKPLFAKKHIGGFTVNALLKELNEMYPDARITPDDYAIVILLVAPAWSWRMHGGFYAVRITPSGYDIELPHVYGLNTYWRKKDFESDRKECTCGIILAQIKSNLCPPKAYGDVKEICVYKRDKERHYKTLRRYGKEIPLDKSGYPVGYARELLQERLKQMKADREKAKANEHDYTEKLNAVRDELKGIYAGLLSDLNEADCFDREGIKSFGLLLQNYSSVLYFVQRAEKNTERKEWQSEAHAERVFNGIRSDLDNLHTLRRVWKTPVEDDEDDSETA